MNEETKTTQGFIGELMKRISIAYELAVTLEKSVVDREERYFGLNGTKEKIESVPDNLADEMFALLQRIMEIIEIAHKYVLEV